MKGLLFILLSFALFSCGSGGYENGVSKESGAWWYLIPIAFGAVAAFLIYQGSEKAKLGRRWIDANGQEQRDKTPAPWYLHGLSIIGLVLAAIVATGTIAYAVSFK